ncbi:MAG: rod shape-determining protein MreC [Sphingomonadaceae bacterium]|nr:rod shape-determining protein MreC [Sphingomonadaceae bacterium]
MAPPSPRRPGFSRRAQYSIFIAYVVAITGAVAALILVLSARFDPDGHSALQSTAIDLTLPITKTGHWIGEGVDTTTGGMSAYFDAASQNTSLKKALATSRRQAAMADQIRLENARLKKLLSIQDKVIKPVASGALVASTGASSRRYAILTVGADRGVKNGQAVLGPDGLVGRIVATGRQGARVLLIVDGGNVTPVKRASDGVMALAIGRGDGMLVLRPITSNAPVFRQGDVFVTSGSGGLYRPGVPVARVTQPGRDGAIAIPAADPTRLDYAIVEPVFQAPPPLPPSSLTDQEVK